jgi:hypothetical protein
VESPRKSAQFKLEKSAQFRLSGFPGAVFPNPQDPSQDNASCGSIKARTAKRVSAYD